LFSGESRPIYNVANGGCVQILLVGEINAEDSGTVEAKIGVTTAMGMLKGLDLSKEFLPIIDIVYATL